MKKKDFNIKELPSDELRNLLIKLTFYSDTKEFSKQIIDELFNRL